MKKDLISVIIPVYNAKEYLQECLQSILEQTYQNFEVLMVDDGSTDGCDTIAKEFSENDGRFHYLSQNNMGPSVARNQGLDCAKGTYILFIDADDYIKPDYIERYVMCAFENKADVVFAGYVKDGNFVKNYSCTGINQQAYIHNIMNGIGGCVWGKLYSSHFIGSTRFNSNYRMREDLIFGLELSRDWNPNTRLAYMDYYGYGYRTVANSVSYTHTTLASQDPAILHIMSLLLEIEADNDLVSNFLKNVIFWDCVAAKTKMQLTQVLQGELMKQHGNRMIITSLKDKLLFQPVMKRCAWKVRVIYDLYRFYAKRELR